MKERYGCLVCDFEGVLTKNLLSFEILHFKPYLIIKAALNFLRNLPKGLEEAVRAFKWNYESYFLKNEEELKRLAKFIYQNSFRNGAIELLNYANRNCDVYILSSANEKIVNEILQHLPENIYKEIKIVASTPEKFLWNKEKEEFVRKLKEGNEVIVVGDSLNDFGMLKAATTSFALRTLSYYISPRKEKKAYTLRSLRDLYYFL